MPLERSPRLSLEDEIPVLRPLEVLPENKFL